jgi:hypothetical protein
MAHTLAAATAARIDPGNALELSAACGLRPRFARARWLSPARFGASELTQSPSAANAVEQARTTSAHVSGMRQHLQCSITQATEMRVTFKQSCIALRALYAAVDAFIRSVWRAQGRYLDIEKHFRALGARQGTDLHTTTAHQSTV